MVTPRPLPTPPISPLTDNESNAEGSPRARSSRTLPSNPSTPAKHSFSSASVTNSSSGSVSLPGSPDEKKGRLPGHGWSSKSNDYEFIGRLARRTNPNTRVQFYGSCASVYRARLTPEARARAIAAGASSLAHGEFALKVCYNVFDTLNYEDLVAQGQSELDVFRRLPLQPNIVHIEHYFTGYAPTKLPADWEADPTLPTLFIVMELCHLSLQNIISHRKGLIKDSNTDLPGTSLFQPNEVMMVARDISSALILLGKHLIAHRDIKADNILIRLPSDGSITRASAMDNIYQKGITVTLVDFGSLFDFHVNDCRDLTMTFPVGLPRGGAIHTIAPEIAFANARKPTLLDYTKADVWSLGVVLTTMMCTGELLSSPLTKTHGIMDPYSKEVIKGALDHIPATGEMHHCLDLVKKIVVVTPSDRWSCRQVYDCAYQVLQAP